MITLLHNNSCSKSNCVLKYLQDERIDFQLRDYQTDPLSKSELQMLLAKLQLRPLDVIRQQEPVFIPFKEASLTDDELINLLAAHPQLLERPILIIGNKAIIGRPFEVAVQFCSHSCS